MKKIIKLDIEVKRKEREEDDLVKLRRDKIRRLLELDEMLSKIPRDE